MTQISRALVLLLTGCWRPSISLRVGLGLDDFVPVAQVGCPRRKVCLLFLLKEAVMACVGDKDRMSHASEKCFEICV